MNQDRIERKLSMIEEIGNDKTNVYCSKTNTAKETSLARNK